MGKVSMENVLWVVCVFLWLPAQFSSQTLLMFNFVKYFCVTKEYLTFVALELSFEPSPVTVHETQAWVFLLSLEL